MHMQNSVLFLRDRLAFWFWNGQACPLFPRGLVVDYIFTRIERMWMVRYVSHDAQFGTTEHLELGTSKEDDTLKCKTPLWCKTNLQTWSCG